MSKRTRSVAGGSVDLVDALVKAGMTVTRARALAKVPQRVLELNPKRPFRDPASQANEAIFVQSGLLAKYRIVAGGRRQILALRFPGEGFLPREHPVDYGLQAIVPSSVIVVRKDDFDKALAEFPELRHLCLVEMQRHAAITYEWLMSCGSRDSTTRVAHLICELAVRSGFAEGQDSLRNPFTQMQMAEITGQTSVNVNRILSDLERSGILMRTGTQMVVADWAEFRRLANFNPEYLAPSSSTHLGSHSVP
jgi:CRP-like cAMP-binding protein